MAAVFRRYGLALTLLVAAGPSACHRADSVLLVEVGGDLRYQPWQFQVTIGAGGLTKTMTVPPVPEAIMLPTSFTVELDRKLTGPVVVTVDAFDEGGNYFATGAVRQEHIQVGEVTIISVILPGTLPPPDDGGITNPAELDAGEPDAP
jgi:hypothetical protein